LLENLNRDELQGVIAHELSHIYHRDTLYMTLAATMLGSIQMLSRMSLRASRFAGGSRYSSGSRSRSGSNSSSKSSGLRAFLYVLLILVSIIGPFFAMLFYFSLSRKREYLADASAARLTRYPEGLASALEKISMSSFIRNANSLTGPMFIINPLRSTDSLLNYSTHPRTEDRIAILRGMNKGAGLVSYQDAYARVTKKSGPLIPPIAMTLASRQETELAIREKSPDIEADSPNKLMDYIRAQNSFIFIECSCGLKMKIPPNFKENKVTCPKCKMENYVVNFNSIDSTPDVDPEGKQVYIRKNTGWETIQCKECNHLINISPLFNSPAIICQMCKSQIVVKKQGEYMVDPAL
ncbi:MAG TPA: M48 family metalloprotease, partial [Natronincola sp.]|nr:M48 family metalloprotease [Natronincola sp.]